MDSAAKTAETMPKPWLKTAAAFLMLSLVATALPMPTFAQIADTSSERIPQSFQFNTNLKQGQTLSPDVMYLQRFLNLSPNTQISATGAGSNSQLTNYFGLKTKDAVMRFQSQYRNEVLAPAGLTTPTGVVGEFTRRKINALLTLTPDNGYSADNQLGYQQTPSSQQYAALQNPAQSSGLTSGQLYNQPIVTNANAGQSANLGVNQSADLQNAYAGIQYDALSQIPQQWQSQIAADMAGQSNLQSYFAQASDGTGPGSENFKKPQILAVTPTIVGSPSDRIRIYGRDFEPHVTLFSNLGTISAISRDGETIDFQLQDFSDFVSSSLYYSSSTQDIFIQAINMGYASDNAAIVKYHFPYYVTASSTNNGVGAKSDTSASDSGLTNGVIALGTAIGAGLLAGAVAKAFAGGATAAATGVAGAAGSAAASSLGADAAKSLINRPFGGRLLFLHPCFDSPNILLYIWNTTGPIPRPIRLVYVPVLSRLYQNFIFRPGGFVMGNYILGGWCTASGTGVVGGTIRQIGTSF